jgi:peptidoglycan/LPS O-acetylase OafA/YrhL
MPSQLLLEDPERSAFDEPAPIVRDEPPPAPHLSAHIPALDAVRGLAILMVTAYRFFPAYDDPSFAGRALTRACGLGFRGVDLFFVLSGFLITGILWDAKGRTHYFRNFYARRALRIFPLYYGALLLTLVLLPTISRGLSPFAESAEQKGTVPLSENGFESASVSSAYTEARQYSPWLWLYGTNILIAWKGDWCFGPYDHFWSLAVEEHFYLVWPLVIFLCSRATAMKVCLAAIVLSVATRTAWLTCGGNEIAAETFTLFRVDALALGGLLALVVRGPNGLNKLRPWALFCCLAFVLTMLPPFVVQKRVPMLRDTIYAILFASVIVLAVTTPVAALQNRLWRSSILRFFGKYSYGMYVVQNFLKFAFAPDIVIATLATATGSILLGRCSYLLLMSLATVLAALATWHLLEKHFLRMKTRFE